MGRRRGEGTVWRCSTTRFRRALSAVRDHSSRPGSLTPIYSTTYIIAPFIIPHSGSSKSRPHSLLITNLMRATTTPLYFYHIQHRLRALALHAPPSGHSFNPCTPWAPSISERCRPLRLGSTLVNPPTTLLRGYRQSEKLMGGFLVREVPSSPQFRRRISLC